jgi:Protein of unknown function (DUF2924)
MAFAATASKRGACVNMTKAAIDIAEALARLSVLTIFELRGEWRRLHRMPPPMRLSLDLLTRGINYKLQERAYGGLSMATARKLEQGGANPNRLSADAPGWTTSEQSAALLCEFHLSGRKLDEAANMRAMDQRGQTRDQVDTAVMPAVRRKCGSLTASCAGLQSWQFPAHVMSRSRWPRSPSHGICLPTCCGSSRNFDRRQSHQPRKAFVRYASEPNSRERCASMTENSAILTLGMAPARSIPIDSPRQRRRIA